MEGQSYLWNLEETPTRDSLTSASMEYFKSLSAFCWITLFLKYQPIYPYVFLFLQSVISVILPKFHLSQGCIKQAGSKIICNFRVNLHSRLI